jgi:DNA-directed RNA polymerase specialized sigma subunit
MTAKEYLSRGRELCLTIKSHEAIIDNLRRMEQSIPTPQFDQEVVDHSRSLRAPFEKWVCMRLDWEDKVKAEKEELAGVQKELGDAIMKIPDTSYQAVLMLRYVAFKNWTDIAAELSFSDSYVYRLHGKALLLVEVPKEDSRVEAE